MAGAVAHSAEATWTRLTERQRWVARQVLLRMIGVGEDGLVTRPRPALTAFSPDGRTVLTVQDGDSIRSTDCEVCGPVSEVAALAERRSTRDFTPAERAKYLHESR